MMRSDVSRITVEQNFASSPAVSSMDKKTREALLKLRQRFITEENFGLNHFEDGIGALLPDKSSPDWKTWSAHGNALMTAYEDIVKDGKPGEWPEPPLSSDVRSGPANALDGLDGQNERAAIRLQRKIDNSGVVPPEGQVRPVRTEKSIFARRIEQLQRDAKGKPGRKRDFLADECVIAGVDTARHRDGTTTEEKCTWCVGCDKKAAGHDANRIKNHAFDCQKIQAEWPELWALVDAERGGSALSVVLDQGNLSALPPVRKPAEAKADKSVKPLPTSSATAQSKGTLREYFTPTKISPERQAQIDL
ncbi:hypothetical protein B0H12DRAFT_1082167, partial [Mycena haematopus]